MNTVDVVIVGAGPVGLSLARLLGLGGHSVAVLERWPQPYPLPRAVHFDDEIGRMFQSMGLTEEVRAVSGPVTDCYEWRNADGDILVSMDWSQPGLSGWPMASFFSQPNIEKVLSEAVDAMETVTLMRGVEVTGLDEGVDSVTVTSADDRSFSARYVIGCDGANSFVRSQMHTAMHDEGFFFDWLIVDTQPTDDAIWSPQNWQLCDPTRPTTVVSGGPGRRRWEFMRLPHETREELDTSQRAWELLSEWGRTPENTVLERHAVYTFAARYADQWNRGRLALAGDSAHQMPPFARQGMCSGMRDAANLAWKLDRVLRGDSRTDLLDTYTSERKQHLQYAIAMSVELGKVICVLDPDAAAARDRRMIAGEADPARVLPVTALPVLGAGVLADGIDIAALRGTTAPQFPVGSGAATALLDDVVGQGATVVIAPGVEVSADVAATIAELAGADVRTVRFGEEAGSGIAAPTTLTDPTGAWSQWFGAGGVAAMLVRPDHYVFGAVARPDDLPALARQYRDRLSTSVPAITGA
ncbi:bifunctional 3-(3-hydroxy-phenyl)propionate/3-hydroxycinnamic acid hydroxylase [Gordonia jinhuaensis]|uniref:3-(3-hydroxyphenyl)propionate hydroxylase n=1 Tax=Gordonia jinhuaensis TaxID=1517702 RepID=A0A916T2V8_9ACTN|nr:bifunctional 3-(3-hydroxy-phenyl)propionate/3-hydroxycinnamic acid hydroxylase [Gordonia jinhuaensis]GGB28690.1 3-(3-hydroxyphenyl)propionate hydroxylase [Gordonia jinhuaensis]